MNRRKVPSGSKQSLEQVFANVQSDVSKNITNRVKTLFDSLGLALDFQSGVDAGNNFSVSVQGSSDEQLSITSGKAITDSGEYIDFQGSTKDWSTESLSDGTYVVKLVYTELPSEPVTVMNAFLLDSSGGEPYTDRKTKFADGSKIELSTVGADLATTVAALGDDELALAIVQISSTTFNTGAWSFDGQSATSGVIDIRDQNRLAFKESLFSDNKFLFKSRNSTGDYAITGDVQFDGDLFYENITPTVGGSGTITAKSLTSDSITMSAGNEDNTNIAGTSASQFTVNGNLVVVSPGNMTNPSNLRIWDIYPTRIPGENMSFVEFRWNYDNLDGAPGGSSDEFVIQENSYDGETYDLGGGDVPGKMLYFSNSGNEYEILSVSAGAGQFTLTVDGTIAGGDATTQAEPARIIDKNLDQYQLIITNVNTGYSQVHILSSEVYRRRPKWAEKLELGDTWSMSLQSENVVGKGQRVTMPSGSYDPDHSGGGQSVVNYNANFENILPDISSTGGLSLTADSQGFIAKISKWGGDVQNTAHEYEIIYSSEIPLDETNYNNLMDGAVEHMVVQAGKVHISAGRPTKFEVGVRPLQNKQPVGDPIFSEVVSGGGGLLPTEQIIASAPVDIRVYESEVITISGTCFDVDYYDLNDQAIYPEHSFGDGRYATLLDGSGNPIENEDYRINYDRDYFNTNRRRWCVDNPAGVTTLDRLRTGVSKADRKILEQNLEVDFRVTKIEFNTYSILDTSAQDPGIIRVYQKGLETSAATLEVEGYSDDNIKQTTNLPIKLASDGTRILIIDGWDPDPTNPNNSCTMKGVVTVSGKPIVVENIDRG